MSKKTPKPFPTPDVDHWSKVMEKPNAKIGKRIEENESRTADDARRSHEAMRESVGVLPAIKLRKPEHRRSAKINLASIQILRAQIIEEMAGSSMPDFYKASLVDDLIGAAMSLGALTVDRRDRREIETSLKQSRRGSSSGKTRRVTAVEWQGEAVKEAKRLLVLEKRDMKTIEPLVHKAISKPGAPVVAHSTLLAFLRKTFPTRTLKPATSKKRS